MSLVGQYLGARLVELRGQRKQKDVAEKAGMSPSQYSRYERGAATPSDVVLMEIAKALGCSIQQIFNFALPTTGKKCEDSENYLVLGAIIGGRLMAFREERCLLLPEIAAAAEIPEELYIQYELGQQIPGDRDILKIANALNIDTELLVGGLSTPEYLKNLDNINKYLGINREGGEFLRQEDQLLRQSADTLQSTLDTALEREAALLVQVRKLSRENWDLRYQLAKLRALLKGK